MAENEAAVKKGGPKKIIILLVAFIALAGGGAFGAAKLGFLQIPGISPKKGMGPPATDLKAVAGDGQVILTWTPAKGAVTYRLKRAEKPEGPFKEIQAKLPTPKFTDKGLTNGKAVVYVVVAMHAKGASLDSEPTTVKPVAPPRKPAPEMAAATRPKRPKATEPDVKLGAQSLAALWNQMEPADLVRVSEKWTERDLGRVISAMNPEQAAALLAEISKSGKQGPERASKLSKELIRLGSVVVDKASGAG